MAKFILQRLIATIPVVFIVLLIVFFMVRLTPGDPAAIIAGDAGTSEQIQAIRESLGLTQPLPVQFGIWLSHLLRGDLGQSFYFKMPVHELIQQRLGPTVSLATLTMLITLLVSLPLGIIAARLRGSLTDRMIMGFSVLGFSVPVFVLGYVLIYLFAVRWRVFPVQGYKPLSEGVVPFLSHLMLPSLTLSVIFIALIARITRASVLEVLGLDFMRTAKAKGLRESTVLLRHGLRNAAVPIVTVIGISIALLVGGVVVTESVYNIPGLGRLTVDAVLSRDYPIIQAVVLLFSLLYIFINLLVDLSYFWIDPRIRT